MNPFNEENYPFLKTMHPAKVKIMSDFIDTVSGKPAAQALPALISAKNQLSSLGLSFSKEETELLLDALSDSLSPEQKAKLDAMKGLLAAV